MIAGVMDSLGTVACRDARPKSPIGALTIVNFHLAKLIAVMAPGVANREPVRMNRPRRDKRMPRPWPIVMEHLNA
jgi:hypothetical protein